MYSKIKTVLPSDHLIGKVSLFLSVMAMFFAVSSGSGGCLYAEECSVGDSESFSNNIRVYSNSTNYHEITGDTNNPNTVDHTLILPNKNGTLLSTAMSFGNNQYLQTNATGDIISNDLPALDIDDDSKVDVSGITSGKYLQTSATGLNFVDVDINETTFDSSSGSEGQILQISGGNLTFQDMASGGAYTLIDSGNLIRNSTATYETFICWYGNTLDPTKNYLLKYDGGSGEVLQQQWIYETYVGLTGDCSSGTKNEWEPGSYHNYTANVVGTLVSGDETAYNRSTCLTLQSLNSSQPTTTLMNVQGQLTFSAVDNQGDLGLWSQGKSSGVIVNSSSSNAVVGQQSGTWSCTVYNGASSPTFSDLTGFYWRFEADTPANISRSWALYEIDY